MAVPSASTELRDLHYLNPRCCVIVLGSINFVSLKWHVAKAKHAISSVLRWATFFVNGKYRKLLFYERGKSNAIHPAACES
jgi:hypothetical protein